MEQSRETVEDEFQKLSGEVFLEFVFFFSKMQMCLCHG